MNTKKHIILVAGETSGDMHGAHLVEALKKLNPQISFSGLGGPHLQTAGVQLYADLTKVAVVGFVEVLKHFGTFKKNFYLILKKVKETKAAGVILIDYPGFNLRLAPELKKLNTKVIYYISPQVWAWKENRVEIIRRYVDKMLVLFPFEKEFYARHNIPVDFVGHPLVDTLKINVPRERLLMEHGLSAEKLTIGLLPGSRPKEVERHLPIMLDAANLLLREFPQIQFLLLKAPSIEINRIKQYLSAHLPFKVIEHEIYAGINASDVCIVCSGTATMETGLLKKPMVVVYKTSLPSFLLAKLFIKIPYIAMVNVIAGRRIVPECIQFEATPQRIAAEIKRMITNEPKIAEIKFELTKIRESLGESGASLRAAQKILEII